MSDRKEKNGHQLIALTNGSCCGNTNTCCLPDSLETGFRLSVKRLLSSKLTLAQL